MVKVQVRIDNASLASQAVGPPNNPFEMSCDGRNFADLADKLHRLPSARASRRCTATTACSPGSAPLRAPASPPPTARSSRRRSSKSTGRARARFDANGDPVGSGGYTQMEANFTLFFGLAVQMYEATLISSDSPFDEFMDGDDHALTSKQLSGWIFLGEGRCVACHVGPEFTDASVAFARQRAVESMSPIELMLMGDGGRVDLRRPVPQHRRPAVRGPGRGARSSATRCHSPGPPPPLCALRRRELPLDDFDFDPDSRCPARSCASRVAATASSRPRPAQRGADRPVLPQWGTGDPGAGGGILRPRRRSGGRRLSTTRPASRENCSNLDPDIQRIGLEDLTREIDGYVVTGEEALVEFLLTLTDERVRDEDAPFDHPGIVVPDGHQGNGVTVFDDGSGRALVRARVVPAVGDDGGDQVGTFLGLESRRGLTARVSAARGAGPPARPRRGRARRRGDPPRCRTRDPAVHPGRGGRSAPARPSTGTPGRAPPTPAGPAEDRASGGSPRRA